jgi:hypothetical protein
MSKYVFYEGDIRPRTTPSLEDQEFEDLSLEKYSAHGLGISSARSE